MRSLFCVLLLLLSGCASQGSSDTSATNAAGAETASADTEPKLICRRERETGSHVAKRVCRTERQIERGRENAENLLDHTSIQVVPSSSQ